MHPKSLAAFHPARLSFGMLRLQKQRYAFKENCGAPRPNLRFGICPIAAGQRDIKIFSLYYNARKSICQSQKFRYQNWGQFADDLFFAMRKRRKQKLPPER